MLEEFIPDTPSLPASPSEVDPAPQPGSEREAVKIQVIGSAWGVNQIVYLLHVLRFSEVAAWTPLVPSPEPGKVMRILIRKITRKA